MPEIQTQLSELARYLDAEFPNIELDEILAATKDDQPVRPVRGRGPVPGWVYGLVAAFLVLLLVGVIPFLLDRSDAPPANTVVPTTIAESAPTTLAERQPSTTVSEMVTTVTSNIGVVAETLEMLDIALEQEEVRGIYGGDVRAQLEYVYSYLAGMTGSAGWPEPAFDTSLLGVESVLTEVDPGPSLLDLVSSPPSSGSGGVPMNPFVAAARLEGTTVDAAFGIVLAFKDDIVDVQWRLGSQRQGSRAMSGSQSDRIGIPPNIIMVQGPRSGSYLPVVIGGLPLEASVVTTTFSDGAKVWQRPFSGMAIFDDPNKQCVPVPEFPVPLSCEFEYTVYDADGDEIFRIVSDPDREPFFFRLDSP